MAFAPGVLEEASQRAFEVRGKSSVLEPLHYGLARMFQVYAEAEGFTVEVFKDAEAALGWLRGT